MNRKIIITVVAILMPLMASAYNAEINGFYYNLNYSKKTAAITWAEGSNSVYTGKVTIPSEVDYNGQTFSVTRIEVTAFSYCTGLTSVEIPNSVTSVGESAFAGCTGLTSIEVPNSVTSIEASAFSGSGLTSFTFPSGVTKISNGTFNGCNGLTSYVIPSHITSIGEWAFAFCENLTSIQIPNSVTNIGYAAFWGTTGLTSIQLPNSVTSIGNNAFSDCTNLTSINIPNSVTFLGQNVFKGSGLLTDESSPVYYVDNCVVGYNQNYYMGDLVFEDGTRLICSRCFSECGTINSVTIPGSVVTICERAFYMSGATYAVIQDGVKEIGKSAFAGCSDLTSVYIGDGVETIGSGAFSSCSNLTNIRMPENVKNIGSGAFSETGWYNNQPDGLMYFGTIAYSYKGEMPENTSIEIREGTTTLLSFIFSGCSGLTSITIPESVTSIGKNAFQNCTNLTSIIIPSKVKTVEYATFGGCKALTTVNIGNVTSIDYWAFGDCEALTSFTIPNSVTTIGDEVFSGCTALTNLTIGSGVTTIGSYLFGYSGCNLNSLTVLAETPPVAQNNSFFNCTAELLVPESAAQKYMETEPWSNFMTIKTLGGSEVQKKKCAKPTVTVGDTYLYFISETEGVTYHFEISNNIFTSGSTEGNLLPFTKKITVSIRASKNGWEDSDPAIIEIDDLKIIGDANQDGKVDAADLVTTANIIMGKKE